MGWRTEYDQQKLALRRVFYMFSAITLFLIAHAAVVQRATYHPPRRDAHPANPQDRPELLPAIDVYPVIGALLLLAKLALAHLDAMVRAPYELMNRADMLSRSLAASAPAHADQCGLPAIWLDSS